MTTIKTNEKITLKCLKEKSKLRVRIITPGYYNNANCQFPRDIRKEGRIYQSPSSGVKLAKGPRGKFFYRINKNGIEIVEDNLNLKEGEKHHLKVYGDDDEKECIICMDQPKGVVYSPCGHYCCCRNCAETISKNSNSILGECPMCRGKIEHIVDRENVA